MKINYKQSLRSNDLQQAVVNKRRPFIDYKKLRTINPEAARTAVLDYLASNGGNIKDCAKVFGVQRVVVYDVVRKSKEGNLKDRSKAPRRVANKTPGQIEELVIKIKNKMGFGPKALSFYLYKNHGIDLSYGTIRSILRRNNSRQSLVFSYQTKNEKSDD